jgi:uncharacterized protein with NRDE domain
VAITRESLQTPNHYYFHGHDVTQEDVIDYCGTWFGLNHKGLVAIFANPKCIPNDSNSEDDGEAMMMKRSMTLV